MVQAWIDRKMDGAGARSSVELKVQWCWLLRVRAAAGYIVLLQGGVQLTIVFKTNRG